MISDRSLKRIMRSEALVALTGDLVRALCVVVVVGVVLLCLAFDAFLARRMFTELHMNDFGRFYYTARAFLDGADMYGPTTATPILVGSETYHLWNMNPPHFHLLILPLAMLSPFSALVWWALMNALSLAISLHLIARELGWRWTWAAMAWTVTAVVLCSATGILVVTGQVTFLLMLPVTVAWAAARDGRWQRAAIYLGIVASIKPFLAIFGIYLLLTRRWSAAVTMAAAACSCVIAGIAVFGWAAYVGWFQVLLKVDWAFAPMNGSIQGLLARTLSENPVFVPLVHAPSAIAPLTAVLVSILAIGSLAVFARDRSAQAGDRVFAGLLLTALLVSPLGWMYYLWLATGPLLGLWQGLDRRPSQARNICIVLAVPGLLLPLYMTTVGAGNPWISLTLGSTYAWTILALWAAVLLDSRITRSFCP